MVAAAVIGGAVVSAGAGAYSANQAGKASSKGADAAAYESARQYDITRNDFAGQRALGTGATSLLGRLYGINTNTSAANNPQVGAQILKSGEVQSLLKQGLSIDEILKLGVLNPVSGDKLSHLRNAYGLSPDDIQRLQQGRFSEAATGAQGAAGSVGAPDMSAFFESPDYQFNLGQGQQAIDRSLAARGRALSGAGVKEGQRFASGLASTEYGNFTNRLMAMAGLGQTATQSTAAAGANAANNIGAAYQNAGNARANAYMQAGQAVNNGAQGGLSNYLLASYMA